MKKDPFARGLAIVLAILAILASTGCDQASAGAGVPIIQNERFIGSETEIIILGRDGNPKATFIRDEVSERILARGNELQGDALDAYADGLLDAFVFVIIDGASVSLIVEATE